MMEVVRVGRQWQIWEDGELVCLPKKNTKHGAQHHAEMLERSRRENEEFEARRQASRDALAAELRAKRAEARSRQGTLI